MATYQIQLPISKSTQFGFKHFTTPQESIKQNFKMLLLTTPGEKIDDPEFGCGLQRYLFSKDSPSLRQEIEQIIREKVSKYIPFINIIDIYFDYDGDTVLLINIKFYIGASGNTEQFSFKFDSIEQ